MLRHIIRNYQRVQKPIVYIVLAQFFLQLVHTAFILIFNIYLTKLGYSDQQIADFTSYRFLGVLSCALPLGLYIKNRSLKPMFYCAGICIPISAFVVIYSAENHWTILLHIFSYLSGSFFSCLQVSMLPFIIRNAEKDMEPEAIALHHATFSCSMILCSFLIFSFSHIPSVFANEKNILLVFACFGFCSLYFVRKSNPKETLQRTQKSQPWLQEYDWGIIITALLPNMIIAIGAGLTIPFINLFFYSVHHMDYDRFSLLNLITAIFVSFAFIYVPEIKRSYGYKIAITLSQSLAVIVLVFLATTEFYSHHWYAVYVAIFCFMLRQPLMNMAGPMTSHLIMNYVGEKNQEMTSALHSAIWSGSWFVSAKIFKYLREYGLPYSKVFLITASIYAIGVLAYHLLILHFEKKELELVIKQA